MGGKPESIRNNSRCTDSKTTGGSLVTRSLKDVVLAGEPVVLRRFCAATYGAAAIRRMGLGQLVFPGSANPVNRTQKEAPIF